MKTHWIILVTLTPIAITIAWLGPVLLADTQAGEAPATSVESDAPAAEQPVLVGTLRGRAFAVHLFTGERYSIEDHSGELVGIHLTGAEFANQFPEIYDATQDMFASEPIADHLPRGDSFPLHFRAGSYR